MRIVLREPSLWVHEHSEITVIVLYPLSYSTSVNVKHDSQEVNGATEFTCLLNSTELSAVVTDLALVLALFESVCLEKAYAILILEKFKMC